MNEFKDKVAVITGAASGIGRGIAERCVREGIKVILADIEESALMQTRRDLETIGGDVAAIVTDVSKSEDVEHLARKTLDSFGAVHLLFNNAGVSSGGSLWKKTLADWEWVLGVNLWGVIYGLRAFLPIMLEQDVDCHIVNTASMMGLVSLPGGGIYSVTKHAVVTISEILYHELKQIDAKVQVSVLCPGGVKTRIGESERNRPEGTSIQPQVSDNDPRDTEAAQKWWKQASEGLLEPRQVAEIVFDAIRNERFYILTHPEYNETIRVRHDDILQGRNPTNPYSVPVS